MPARNSNIKMAAQAVARITQACKSNEPMVWTHKDVIGLSNLKCVKCHGWGFRPGAHRSDNEPCPCVLRAIFRACLRRFWCCEDNEGYVSAVRYEHSPGVDSMATWTRAVEDYRADFCLIARRFLDERNFKIFRFHFLHGADWRACCRLLRIDRGTFFHAVYRIEQRLGRAYRETRPYGLFPTDEYFGGTIRKVKTLPVAVPIDTAKRPRLIPPLRQRPPLREAA
jgi:hypothetical protein